MRIQSTKEGLQQSSELLQHLQHTLARLDSESSSSSSLVDDTALIGTVEQALAACDGWAEGGLAKLRLVRRLIYMYSYGSSVM